MCNSDLPHSCMNPSLLNIVSSNIPILTGVGHVYGDLNKAARVLIRSAGKETSKTVEHKLVENSLMTIRFTFVMLYSQIW